MWLKTLFIIASHSVESEFNVLILPFHLPRVKPNLWDTESDGSHRMVPTEWVSSNGPHRIGPGPHFADMPYLIGNHKVTELKFLILV